VTELVVEFSSSAYLTDTQLSRLKQIPVLLHVIKSKLLHHLIHRRAYKKRTEIALAIAQQLEEEGHFPQANYAFDNGLLTLDLTRFLERLGKHWVSEVECSRHIQWYGQ